LPCDYEQFTTSVIRAYHAKRPCSPRANCSRRFCRSLPTKGILPSIRRPVAADLFVPRRGRHYVHHDRGVWDFDLWGFFEEVPGHPFPYRRRGEHDFGPSKFGRDPDNGNAFKGRKVDVIGRSIRMPKNEKPIEAVPRYLREARTKSASLLAERPVISVWPVENRGRVIWDAR
jgi:hypothetical protein